jgi:hypothetical protein
VTKKFNSYLEFYNELKGVDLTGLPCLFFFYNATANSLGCNCTRKSDIAKNRYRTLLTTLDDNEKKWLKQHFSADILTLQHENEKYTIELG